MEIRFYKPTVLDISKMQELVRPEVEKGIIDEDKTVPANVKNILYKKYNIVE